MVSLWKSPFFAGKSPTCLVHHRSVSVKHPSRTSTLLDVFIMCVLMNIAFCSSNISCAGPHQQTLFVGPKYVCSARTINRDILFPYHHIISLPKKTSTNITPFGHGSKCLEVAWGRRPRWSVACATAPCWVQWWDGSKRCRWWIPTPGDGYPIFGNLRRRNGMKRWGWDDIFGDIVRCSY